MTFTILGDVSTVYLAHILPVQVMERRVVHR